MNASELAKAMLEWGEAKLRLGEMEAEIKSAVLELGKTQTVGNVRASYSRGRKSYRYQESVEREQLTGEELAPYQSTETDYRAACKALTDEELAPFQSIKTDYRAACKAFNIGLEFTQGKPSVKVKLI